MNTNMNALAHMNPRVAGAMTIIGALTMIAGAITWGASGADLDAALTGGGIGDYLLKAHATEDMLRINITLWTIGVLIMCAGGVQLALMGRSRPQPAGVAFFAFAIGAGSAIVFFPMWMGIVIGLAPAHADGADHSAVAIAIGQGATIADWIATTMILSVGTVCVAQAGKGIWVPRWLVTWSYVAIVTGVLTTVGLLVGQRSTYAMLDVPVGLGWMIAAGIVALRLKPR
ncbi:MAG: hypothetical protein RBT71_01315 [Flavobacteriales bacterium]|jgi:hypothetical protein|nr:hypothetical protein [Flavobacteriales bacterium]